MTAKDAIIIANRSTMGNSYDPAIQLAHGGMVFPNGHKLPHYNPGIIEIAIDSHLLIIQLLFQIMVQL